MQPTPTWFDRPLVDIDHSSSHKRVFPLAIFTWYAIATTKLSVIWQEMPSFDSLLFHCHFTPPASIASAMSLIITAAAYALMLVWFTASLRSHATTSWRASAYPLAYESLATTRNTSLMLPPSRLCQGNRRTTGKPLRIFVWRGPPTVRFPLLELRSLRFPIEPIAHWATPQRICCLQNNTRGAR